MDRKLPLIDALDPGRSWIVGDSHSWFEVVG